MEWKVRFYFPAHIIVSGGLGRNSSTSLPAQAATAPGGTLALSNNVNTTFYFYPLLFCIYFFNCITCNYHIEANKVIFV